MPSKICNGLAPLRIGALTVAALLTVGCLGQATGPAVLSPEGSSVEFAQSTPSRKVAQLIGPIDAESTGKEVSEAEESARTGLRNKAASMGATLVTIDNSIGQRVLFGDAVRVTIVGRAFRAAD